MRVLSDVAHVDHELAGAPKPAIRAPSPSPSTIENGRSEGGEGLYYCHTGVKMPMPE